MMFFKSNPLKMMSLSLLSIVSIALAATVSATSDGTNAYTAYPSVAKTASINGFADKIYDQLPECAKECVKQSTSNTHVHTGILVVCVSCLNLVVLLVTVLLKL